MKSKIIENIDNGAFPLQFPVLMRSCCDSELVVVLFYSETRCVCLYSQDKTFNVGYHYDVDSTDIAEASDNTIWERFLGKLEISVP